MSSLFSSMSLNLLYTFSIFLLTSCEHCLSCDNGYTCLGRCHLIRYEEVVPPGYFLHDVSLDQVVLQHGHAIVDQDGRLGRLQHTGHVSRVTIQAVKHVGSLGPCCGWGGINSLHSWWSQGLLIVMSTSTLHSLFEHSGYSSNNNTHLKVASEVSRRPLHVDCGDLQGDCLELRQQVQVHEVFLRIKYLL